MRYNPTNDYVFKRIFGHKGNENIAKDLIEAIVGEKFSNIKIENPILQSDDITGKTGILDVRLKADDSNVDIEMQVVRTENIQDRALWYWSKMFQESIIRGEDYSKTNRTICIVITDFNIEALIDNKDYHNKYMALNCRDKNNLLTNKMEIHIIELTKMDSTNAIENNLKEWCTFLKYPERIGDSVMNENENIKAAKEELEMINSDDLEKRRADEREKALMDHIWWKNSAIKEGKEIGIKEGKEIGIKEGREIGIKEGKKEGIKEAKKEIANTLIKENMPIDKIVKITGLSKEEIEDLK